MLLVCSGNPLFFMCMRLIRSRKILAQYNPVGILIASESSGHLMQSLLLISGHIGSAVGYKNDCDSHEVNNVQLQNFFVHIFHACKIFLFSCFCQSFLSVSSQGVDPGRRNSSELNGVDEWKPITLSRKGIRYVDMHEPNEEGRTKPTSLEQLPPIHPSTSDTTYHSINYDLTRAIPPLLLRRTGPVERALDRKVWLELTNLLEKRIFNPLDYAAHLTLELISMLLPTGALDDPDRQVKLGLLEAKNRRLRRDLYNR